MEDFRATTQYGDFYGEVAFDGHNGAFHLELAGKANRPPGYWPIGFSLHSLAPDESGLMHIQLILVRLSDYNIDKKQNVPDQLYKIAQEAEELRTYPLDMEIPYDEFNSLIKRVSIKACVKEIPQNIIRVDHDNRIQMDDEDS